MSILSKLGLMRDTDFWPRVHREFGSRSIRVIEGRQHELLIDIAATADILVNNITNFAATDPDAKAAIQRLQTMLFTYKIVEQDQNIPPSTIKNGESRMMEYPG